VGYVNIVIYPVKTGGSTYLSRHSGSRAGCPGASPAVAVTGRVAKGSSPRSVIKPPVPQRTAISAAVTGSRNYDPNFPADSAGLGINVHRDLFKIGNALWRERIVKGLHLHVNRAGRDAARVKNN